MLISIVFSFRNEEQVLPELINRITTVLKSINLEYELIFVNDDSTDNSLNVLLQHRQTNQSIKIINMSRRFGIHPCVLAGMRQAKGDAVIYMDADLQDPPELIPQLIEKWQSGADVVNTVRTKRLGENFLKMWITKLAYGFLNSVSNIEVPMNMGEYKLLSRRVIDEIIQLDEADPFFRGLVRWVGFKQENVYYIREPRFDGKTHFSLFGTGPLKEFMRGITSFSLVPLYLAIILGFLSFIFSCLFMIYIIIMKILGLNLPGWTALMVSISFFGGTILLTNGFTGIYIGKIHEQVKHRPNYIIKDAIGI